MFNINTFGKGLMSFGAILIVIGAILALGGKTTWFGRLPGDIYVHKKNLTFFFPITTSILVSLLISALLMLFRRR